MTRFKREVNGRRQAKKWMNCSSLKTDRESTGKIPLIPADLLGSPQLSEPAGIRSRCTENKRSHGYSHVQYIGITIFQATLEGHAQSVVAEFNKYFTLVPTGGRLRERNKDSEFFILHLAGTSL